MSDKTPGPVLGVTVLDDGNFAITCPDQQFIDADHMFSHGLRVVVSDDQICYVGLDEANRPHEISIGEVGRRYGMATGWALLETPRDIAPFHCTLTFGEGNVLVEPLDTEPAPRSMALHHALAILKMRESYGPDRQLAEAIEVLLMLDLASSSATRVS